MSYVPLLLFWMGLIGDGVATQITIGRYGLRIERNKRVVSLVKKFGFKAVWIVKIAIGLLCTLYYAWVVFQDGWFQLYQLWVLPEDGRYQFLASSLFGVIKVILVLLTVYLGLELFRQVYWAIKIILGGEEAIAEINSRFPVKSD